MVRPLEAALAELPGDEKGLRARVSARLAKALMFTHDARRRESLAETAITLARDHGDPAVLAGVLRLGDDVSRMKPDQIATQITACLRLAQARLADRVSAVVTDTLRVLCGHGADTGATFDRTPPRRTPEATNVSSPRTRGCSPRRAHPTDHTGRRN